MRRWGRAGTLVAAAVVLATAVSVGAPPAAAAPAQWPGPAIAVIPSWGLRPGDQAYLVGLGFPGEGLSQSAIVHACRDEVLEAPEDPALVAATCRPLLYTGAPFGAFVLLVRALSPGWEVVHARSNSDGNPVATAVVDVADPPAPAVGGTFQSGPDLIEGGDAAIWGWVHPQPAEGALSARRCHAVPADASDPAAVAAACDGVPGASVELDPTGGAYVRVPVALDTVAVWFGGEVGGTHVGTAMPVTVSERSPPGP